ncbi:MAG: PAS domain S-box protein, partial [Actinomycetota bacterium]
VLGYVPEELIKRKYFWDFCAPEDCDVFKQRALDVFSQKEKIINLENRVLAKDGRAVWLSTSGIPLLKDDGTLIGYRGSDTDITESKILNEKLNISEEKFSKAFHVNPSACGFTDLITGKYIEVNEAFYSLFGFEKDEVIGKNAVELGILTQDALKDLTLAIGKSEKIVNLETNLKTKNGDIRYVLLSADDVYLRGEKCRFTVVNNITELANSKEELLKSKNRYSLLSEQSRIFTWEVDENGLYTFVDNISEIVLGYKPEELINRKYFYDICPPEDREVFKQGALDVFRKKEKFANLENRIQVKDGSIIWVSTNGIPIFKDDGALIGYHGSDTDITERRAAADELRASEEKFRIYTEKAPIAIFISDGMGRLIDVNIAACTMVGLAKEELLKLSIRDFISLENILKSPNYFNEMQSKGYSQGELILQNKEGKQFWILLTTSMIDKNHFIAFCTDITEQKKTEEAIFIEKERSHMTLSSIGDGVISTDKKGNVMMINKAAEELTGWKHEEAFGRPWEEVFNIIDEFTQERCENPNLNMTGKGSIVDYGSHAILISKEGIKKPIENSMAPIMGPENKLIGLVLVFRDISDKKKKQEEIIYLSYHDELTGLYNRRFYEEELKRLNTKRNLPMTIVMADLNGLKLVNDSFGHVMGDELIKKVANVLRKGFRADDIIARLGGDEFVIILPKTDVFEAAQIIKRLISIALKEKVSDFDISISIGYATKNNEDEDILEIFNSAE